MTQRYTFSKELRLKSKVDINILFENGHSYYHYPIVFKYILSESAQAFPKVVFVCPKRKFKHATVRNLIRRRMKEAYRLHWQELVQQSALHIMMIYSDSKVNQYDVIKRGILAGLHEINKNTQNLV
jgi:ribonuclease P protein component